MAKGADFTLKIAGDDREFLKALHKCSVETQKLSKDVILIHTKFDVENLRDDLDRVLGKNNKLNLALQYNIFDQAYKDAEKSYSNLMNGIAVVDDEELTNRRKGLEELIKETQKYNEKANKTQTDTAWDKYFDSAEKLKKSFKEFADFKGSWDEFQKIPESLRDFFDDFGSEIFSGKDNFKDAVKSLKKMDVTDSMKKQARELRNRYKSILDDIVERYGSTPAPVLDIEKLTGKTKGDARKAGEEIGEEVNDGISEKLDVSGRTVQINIDKKHLADQVEQANDILDNIDNHIVVKIDFGIDNKKMSEITQGDIEQFLKDNGYHDRKNRSGIAEKLIHADFKDAQKLYEETAKFKNPSYGVYNDFVKELKDLRANGDKIYVPNSSEGEFGGREDLLDVFRKAGIDIFSTNKEGTTESLHNFAEGLGGKYNGLFNSEGYSPDQDDATIMKEIASIVQKAKNDKKYFSYDEAIKRGVISEGFSSTLLSSVFGGNGEGSTKKLEIETNVDEVVGKFNNLAQIINNLPETKTITINIETTKPEEVLKRIQKGYSAAQDLSEIESQLSSMYPEEYDEKFFKKTLNERAKAYRDKGYKLDKSDNKTGEIQKQVDLLFRADEAIRQINTADLKSAMDASGTISTLADESTAMGKIKDAADKASGAKEKFAKTNKNVATSAEKSAEKINAEATAFERLISTLNQGNFVDGVRDISSNLTTIIPLMSKVAEGFEKQEKARKEAEKKKETEKKKPRTDLPSNSPAKKLLNVTGKSNLQNLIPTQQGETGYYNETVSEVKKLIGDVKRSGNPDKLDTIYDSLSGILEARKADYMAFLKKLQRSGKYDERFNAMLETYMQKIQAKQIPYGESVLGEFRPDVSDSLTALGTKAYGLKDVGDKGYRVKNFSLSELIDQEVRKLTRTSGFTDDDRTDFRKALEKSLTGSNIGKIFRGNTANYNAPLATEGADYAKQLFAGIRDSWRSQYNARNKTAAESEKERQSIIQEAKKTLVGLTEKGNYINLTSPERGEVSQFDDTSKRLYEATETLKANANPEELDALYKELAKTLEARKDAYISFLKKIQRSGKYDETINQMAESSIRSIQAKPIPQDENVLSEFMPYNGRSFISLGMQGYRLKDEADKNHRVQNFSLNELIEKEIQKASRISGIQESDVENFRSQLKKGFTAENLSKVFSGNTVDYSSALTKNGANVAKTIISEISDQFNKSIKDEIERRKDEDDFRKNNLSNATKSLIGITDRKNFSNLIPESGGGYDDTVERIRESISTIQDTGTLTELYDLGTELRSMLMSRKDAYIAFLKELQSSEKYDESFRKQAQSLIELLQAKEIPYGTSKYSKENLLNEFLPSDEDSLTALGVQAYNLKNEGDKSHRVQNFSLDELIAQEVRKLTRTAGYSDEDRTSLEEQIRKGFTAENLSKIFGENSVDYSSSLTKNGADIAKVIISEMRDAYVAKLKKDRQEEDAKASSQLASIKSAIGVDSGVLDENNEDELVKETKGQVRNLNTQAQNEIRAQIEKEKNNIIKGLRELQTDEQYLESAQIEISEAIEDVRGINPWQAKSVEELLDPIAKSKATLNTFRRNKDSYTKSTNISSLYKEVAKFIEDNGNLSGQYGYPLVGIRDELKKGLDSGREYSAADEKDIRNVIRKYTGEAIQSGQASKGLKDIIKDQVKSGSGNFIAQFFGAQDVLMYIQQAVMAVKELDTQMTELRKVSNASGTALTDAFSKSAETAKDLGSTVTDVISSTADWSRLGYNLKDSEELARVTTLYQKVGDNIDSDTANQSMISTLQGFQLNPDQAERIVDEFNEVSNNFPID